jgi:hypothetical protein
MSETYFTPASARKTLRAIRHAAERLCEIYRTLESKSPRSVESDEWVEPAYFKLVEELHAFLGEIGSRGARVKDLKRGLLEFPARREGRAVMLSWEVGERSLAYWREVGAGDDSRRPIDDDGPWEGSQPTENPGQSG